MERLPSRLRKALALGIALSGFPLAEGLLGQDHFDASATRPGVILSQPSTPRGVSPGTGVPDVGGAATAIELSTRPTAQRPLQVKTTQFRRYQIRPELLEAFVSWWRQTLVPVRTQLGFVVEFAFVDHERSEFIWAVSVPGDQARFLEVQERYVGSPERARAMETLPGIEATYVGFIAPVY